MSADPRLPDTITSLPATLAYWAGATPGAPALIVAGGPVVTYAALWRAAEELATSLNRLGVGRRDRVVLLLPEGPHLALSLLGTAAAAIALPLSSALTAAELNAALLGFDAVAAIVDPSLPDSARACLAESGVAVFDLAMGDGLEEVALAGEMIRPPHKGTRPQARDTAVVSQTSGTTGAPKRMPRAHGAIVQSGRVHRARFGLDHRDRALAVAPMTLSLGRTALMHGIAAGSALIFPRSSDPPGLCTAIAEERPTWMHASAGVLELLARYLRDNPTWQLPPTLRFVRVTAAPISPQTCDELSLRLGAPILPGYSTSEIGLIATALPSPAWQRPGSVGRPIQEVSIVDGDANAVGSGGEGEIWVRTTKDFSGYLNATESTTFTPMPGGWLRTGDVGYLDEDGFLFLTGRRNELINRGGAKIAPAEVDEVLLTHPAVLAGATFAVPDERLGEDIVAAVVLAAGMSVTPRELRAWMLDRLATYKAPRRIWFVDHLPRTATGKVQRGVLRDRYVGDGVMG